MIVAKLNLTCSILCSYSPYRRAWSIVAEIIDNSMIASVDEATDNNDVYLIYCGSTIKYHNIYSGSIKGFLAPCAEFIAITNEVSRRGCRYPAVTCQERAVLTGESSGLRTGFYTVFIFTSEEMAMSDAKCAHCGAGVSRMTKWCPRCGKSAGNPPTPTMYVRQPAPNPIPAMSVAPPAPVMPVWQPPPPTPGDSTNTFNFLPQSMQPSAPKP